MNYLAHAYLSFRQPELLLGNMISDYVKGKAKFSYPAAVQDGIMLHRAIDTFTDEHPVNVRARQIFKPVVGLYASAFVDVVYDHFLATDPIAFSTQPLGQFSQWVYKTLEPFQPLFPERFAGMFPYMKSQDWLLNYQHKWGIERSMEGLVRRAKYLEESQPAFQVFEQHYNFLEGCYQHFFPELMLFVNNYYRDKIIAPGKP